MDKEENVTENLLETVCLFYFKIIKFKIKETEQYTNKLKLYLLTGFHTVKHAVCIPYHLTILEINFHERLSKYKITNTTSYNN